MCEPILIKGDYIFMQDNKNFLAAEPIGKLLLKLSIPTVIAQLINMLYNIVDRIYIGHIPSDGSLALTGVGVCMPIIMIVTAFAALVSSGGAPRASIYMGKQDNESAENILGNCFLLQIVISLILTAILLIWSKDLLLAFGASENTISYATDYMHIYAFGTLFVQLTLGMNAFITAQGFTTISMVSVLIGAICNITLDPVFIFAFHMGVKGAALATVISQAISTIWVVSFLCGKKTHLHLRKKYMRLEPKVFVPCVTLGLAAFIMQASESIVTVCFNSSLLRYGGDIAVGAMTIITSVSQLATLPLQGICQGGQPIMSYNFGAGNKERVKKAFFTQFKVCTIFTSCFWLIMLLFPKLFAGIFSNNTDLITYTAWALRIYMAGIFSLGFQVSCQQSFMALGQAKVSLLLACLRKLILLIPLIFILPLFIQDKVFAVFLAEPISDIVAATITTITFMSRFNGILNKGSKMKTAE